MQFEVEATIQSDGTLVLDEKLPLPPGRVRVVVQGPTVSPEVEDYWRTLRAIWEAQKARGHVPRTVEEVVAERKALNDEMEEEIQEAMRLQEESQRLRKERAAKEAGA